MSPTVPCGRGVSLICVKTYDREGGDDRRNRDPTCTLHTFFTPSDACRQGPESGVGFRFREAWDVGDGWGIPYASALRNGALAHASGGSGRVSRYG